MTDKKFYDLAVEDLTVANKLYKMNHFSHAIFSFQQSVEKAMKGMGLATKMVTFEQLTLPSVGHNAYRIFRFGIANMKEKASALLEIGDAQPNIFDGLGLPIKEVKKYHSYLLSSEGRVNGTQPVDFFELSDEDFEQLICQFKKAASEKLEIPSQEFLPFMEKQFSRMTENHLISEEEAAQALVEIGKPGIAEAFLQAFAKGVEVEVWVSAVLYPLSIITSAHESETRYPCDYCGHHPIDLYRPGLPIVDWFSDLAAWHSECLIKLRPLFEN